MRSYARSTTSRKALFRCCRRWCCPSSSRRTLRWPSCSCMPPTASTFQQRLLRTWLGFWRRRTSILAQISTERAGPTSSSSASLSEWLPRSSWASIFPISWVLSALMWSLRAPCSPWSLSCRRWTTCRSWTFTGGAAVLWSRTCTQWAVRTAAAAVWKTSRAPLATVWTASTRTSPGRTRRRRCATSSPSPSCPPMACPSAK
mmetsp:Transcript_1978/g.7145  ORF Transcript_1978/g.7145 Transcript_1978/m.7145 type:complete len:202 (-) Transcript_1978:1235-1840(-)